MTIGEATQLQSEFSITLPKDYVEFVTGDIARDLDSEAITISSSVLRESNVGCRNEDPWGFKWEPRFWWIGDDGAGGFYFINTEESDSRVYYCDHEECPKDFDDKEYLHSTDLGNHISDQVELEAEMKDYDAKMREKVANRRWWQFWIPKSWGR